ncbi:ABC transporter permease [Saccharibacillus alkalitolerans]|uniref:ABC transporter permease n=1 Tax=Saccharibacillus alkalitolerans TaxID=2705290 RepID=UPI001F375B23|nr:ABC transporter permease [Saccharibacillus alkalitolerans]
MSKKLKYLILMILLVSFSVSCFLVYFKFNPGESTISFELKTNQALDAKVYYQDDGNETYIEKKSSLEHLPADDQFHLLSFTLPENTTRFRLDLGEQVAKVTIVGIEISIGKHTKTIPLNLLSDEAEQNDISSVQLQGKELMVTVQNGDPFFDVNVSAGAIRTFLASNPNYYTNVMTWSMIAALYWLLIAFLMAKLSLSYLKSFFDSIISSRSVLLSLAKNDLKSRFSGSNFGILWALISPLLTILVYWFVFQIGFRNSAVQDIPFIIWFIPGIIPWFFFSDSLNIVTNSFVEYSYLVKKVVFKIELLPLIKLASVSFINMFFVLIYLVFYFSYGNEFSWINFQAIYYLFALHCMLFGLTLLTSTIVVFFKDLSQILAILLQFGFWLTPIVWDTSNAPGFLGKFFELNPLVYIIEGFRDSFLYDHWFYEKPALTLYFWGLTLFIVLAGLLANKKLKPHFSDVL